MPYYLFKPGFVSSEGLKQHCALQQLAKQRKAEPDQNWQILYRPSKRKPETVFGRRAA